MKPTDTVDRPFVARSPCLDDLELKAEKCKVISAEKDVPLIQDHDLLSIWQWNCNIPASTERCVDEMIREHIRAQPMAPAVCAWDGEFNYHELDRFATHVANQLLNLGVQPESIVPLCFVKSRWMTVAMLAVMKAGAGFVALDPSQPERRLIEVVGQVRASVLLSSSKYEGLGLRLVNKVVTLSEALFTEHLIVNPIIHPTCERLRSSSILYVVFTSGSTGIPKGVVIEHRNLASAISNQVDRLGITASSRLYDFASYSYDVSISNALAILSMGGCICTPSEQDRRDNIPGSIVSLKANATALTPSVARLLTPDALPKPFTLVLVGEPVYTADLCRWNPWTRVICRYGVSESPAASTIYDASPFTNLPRHQPPTIGRGVGLATWIVDPNDHNALSPLGATGELLLEGPSLGRGYLNDDEKTAATFIHDPEWLRRGTSAHPGRYDRLYKTGDLVRYGQDGTLIFVGRKDNQVKIRGQRVELGDIERHIQESLKEDQKVIVELVMLPGPVPRQTLVALVQQ